MRETRIPFMQSLIPRVLDGSKPISRRTNGLQKVNAEPDAWTLQGCYDGCALFKRKTSGETCYLRCPYGGPGDILLPTETFAAVRVSESEMYHDVCYFDAERGEVVENNPDLMLFYRANGVDELPAEFEMGEIRWRPPMFMPKWASRGRLEILSVRAERVQDITEEDARAEGVEPVLGSNGWNYRDGFMLAWRRTYGPESWDRSDWCWRLEFRRVER